MQSRSMFTGVSDFRFFFIYVILHWFAYFIMCACACVRACEWVWGVSEWPTWEFIYLKIMYCYFIMYFKSFFLRTSRSLVSTGCSLRELLTTYCSRGSSPLWLLLIRADWQSPTHTVNRYYLNPCWGNESIHHFIIEEPTVLLYRAGLSG